MTEQSAVRTVTICSSSKFYDTARRAEDALRGLGFTVHTPRYDFSEQHVRVGEADKRMLTHEFLRKIDDSDAVFVIANGGYAGVSVCIEVGYAAGQGKKVYFSELPKEFALRALVDGVVPVEGIADEMPGVARGRAS